MSRAVAALLAAAWSAPAWAGYDLLSQDLAVDLVTSPTELGVKATVRVRADAALADTAFIAPTGTVTEVAVDGVAAQFSVAPSTSLLTVQLPTPLAAGQEASVAVAFNVAPACAVGGGRVECVRSGDFTFLSTLSAQVRWYLASSNQSDPFTAKLTLRLPAGHRAAATQGSTPVTSTLPDGSERWSFDSVVPTTDLGFVAGALSEVRSTGGRVVGLYRSEATKPVMETVVSDAARYLPVMESWYGPLPGQRVQVSFAPRNFQAGAMGMLNLVILNDFVTEPAYSYIIPQVPHEVAHSWWGNLSMPETPFLSEAMAEYSLWRAKEEVDGEAIAGRGRRMNATWYMYSRTSGQDLAILSSSIWQSPLFVPVVYHKGSVVVRTLEEFVGKEKFTRGLRAALAVQPSLSADAWVEAIGTASGVDVTLFRQRWLDATGFPKLVATPQLTLEAGGWKARLDVSMQGSFPMKLPVRVRFDDATEQRFLVPLDQAVTPWSATFARRPALIELDSSWTAVRELESARTCDVTFDGEVDGADLIELSLHLGGALPAARRIDGAYDPLFDFDGDRRVDETDVELLMAEARP